MGLVKPAGFAFHWPLRTSHGERVSKPNLQIVYFSGQSQHCVGCLCLFGALFETGVHLFILVKVKVNGCSLRTTDVLACSQSSYFGL